MVIITKMIIMTITITVPKQLNNINQNANELNDNNDNVDSSCK